MKNSGKCDIENIIITLEQAIENRKTQMRHARIQVASSNTHVISHLFSEIFNRTGGSYGQISLALEQGGEFAHNFIKKAQENIEQRPWDVLRKVAVYSFGIGLFLNLRHRKSPTGEKE